MKGRKEKQTAFEEVRVWVGSGDEMERLHATRVNRTAMAVIQNVPYFDTHNVHYGDVVELKRLSAWKRQKPGMAWRIKRVVERDWTARFCVGFEGVTTATQRADLDDIVQECGGIIEFAAETLAYIALREVTIQQARNELTSDPDFADEDITLDHAARAMVVGMLEIWRAEKKGTEYYLAGGRFPLEDA